MYPFLTRIEKNTFIRVFRQSIYNNKSLLKLKELIKRLSGELEIDDEALFGGHRKGKRGWGSEGKNLFGIYQRNGKVIITFPVSDRKHDTFDKTTYHERFLVLYR
jgi:hypothetical protein